MVRDGFILIGAAVLFWKRKALLEMLAVNRIEAVDGQLERLKYGEEFEENRLEYIKGVNEREGAMQARVAEKNRLLIERRRQRDEAAAAARVVWLAERAAAEERSRQRLLERDADRARAEAARRRAQEAAEDARLQREQRHAEAAVRAASKEALPTRGRTRQ